ncbi:MAG: GHKL domain-containing protein [Candidatus Lokiarchaeota archaeon]|nr:GHKL domain-containing protein [Candidatus Lokiarchaeota archaeon]
MLKIVNFNFILAIYSVIVTLITALVSRKHRDMQRWLVVSSLFTIGNILFFFAYSYTAIFGIISNLTFFLTVCVFYTLAFYNHYNLIVENKNKNIKKQHVFAYFLILIVSLILFPISLSIPIYILSFSTLILQIENTYFKKSIIELLKTILIAVAIFSVSIWLIAEFGYPFDELTYVVYFTMITLYLMIALVAPLEHKLTKSETKYRKAFDRAELYKDLFIHDINNILQTLQMSLEILQNLHYNSKQSKKFNEVVKIAQEQIQRGSLLSTTVKSLSEIELEKFKSKPTNPKKILEDSIYWVKNKYKNERIEILEENQVKNIKVVSNELLFEIFNNILENAIKHNRNEVKKIKIRTSKIIIAGQKYILIEFVDNGLGINKKLKEMLFNKRHIINSNPKRIGIGLSFIKALMESYGGFMDIKNLNHGAGIEGSKVQLFFKEVS